MVALLDVTSETVRFVGLSGKATGEKITIDNEQ